MAQWLRTHPAAWSGWPSYVVLDREQAAHLADRLNQCGTHIAVTPDMLPLIGELIQQIRTEHRRTYAAGAAKWAW